MKITNIIVHKNKEVESSIVAIASIVIDDCFAIHGIKIINGNNGLFIAMPSKRLSNGEYKDIVHPINFSARELIQNAVLNAYNKLEEEN